MRSAHPRARARVMSFSTGTCSLRVHIFDVAAGVCGLPRSVRLTTRLFCNGSQTLFSSDANPHSELSLKGPNPVLFKLEIYRAHTDLLNTLGLVPGGNEPAKKLGTLRAHMQSRCDASARRLNRTDLYGRHPTAATLKKKLVSCS